MKKPKKWIVIEPSIKVLLTHVDDKEGTSGNMMFMLESAKPSDVAKVLKNIQEYIRLTPGCRVQFKEIIK